MPKKKNLSDAQGGDDLVASVQSDTVQEPVSEVRSMRSDVEIVAVARAGERLTPEEHERLRFIPGPHGERGWYAELWTKQELRYGPKESIFIPLMSGEKLERKDSKGTTAYPMEFASVNGVKCYVPKGRSVEVPAIVARVLRPYIASLHPAQYEFKNISAPEFRFE